MKCDSVKNDSQCYVNYISRVVQCWEMEPEAQVKEHAYAEQKSQRETETREDGEI